jgi:ribosomal protein S26
MQKGFVQSSVHPYNDAAARSLCQISLEAAAVRQTLSCSVVQAYMLPGSLPQLHVCLQIRKRNVIIRTKQCGAGEKEWSSDVGRGA